MRRLHSLRRLCGNAMLALCAGLPAAHAAEPAARGANPGAKPAPAAQNSATAAPKGEQFAWVVATNVYLKSSHGWRLVAHHASPGSADEAHDSTEAASILH